MVTSSDWFRVVRKKNKPMIRLISDDKIKGNVFSEKIIATPTQTNSAAERINKFLLITLKTILRLTILPIY